MEGAAPEALRAVLWSRLIAAGYPVDPRQLTYWDWNLIGLIKEMEDEPNHDRD